MDLLDNYEAAQKAMFDYFGYTEDWVVIPVDCCREYFWSIDQDADGSGDVYYADTLQQLEDQDAGDFYHCTIYQQRFLSKWVYRGKDFTMIACDTHVDGDKFLCVFSNHKEIIFEGLWDE